MSVLFIFLFQEPDVVEILATPTEPLQRDETAARDDREATVLPINPLTRLPHVSEGRRHSHQIEAERVTRLRVGLGKIYDTVASASTLEVGVRVCRTGGRIVMVGVATPARFEWTPLYFKEIELIGSNGCGVEEWEGRRSHTPVPRDRHRGGVLGYAKDPPRARGKRARKHT